MEARGYRVLCARQILVSKTLAMRLILAERALTPVATSLLAARVTLAPVVQGFEFAAVVVMMTAPVMLAFVHSPVLLALQVNVGIALLGVRLVFHLLTLPVELDASFRRALPILEAGRFLDAGTCPAPTPSCALRPSPTWPRHSWRS